MVFISSDPEASTLEHSLVMLAALIRFAQLDLDLDVRLQSAELRALAIRFDEGLDRLLAMYQDGNLDADKRDQLREIIFSRAMPAPGVLLAVNGETRHVVRIQPQSDGMVYLGGEIPVVTVMDLPAGELVLESFGGRMAAPVHARRD